MHEWAKESQFRVYILYYVCMYISNTNTGVNYECINSTLLIGNNYSEIMRDMYYACTLYSDMHSVVCKNKPITKTNVSQTRLIIHALNDL